MSQTTLIVDDSLSARGVAGIISRGASYEVIEGCGGQGALFQLSEHRNHPIVSYVTMLKRDSISLVNEVKQLPDCKFTPIGMLANEAEATKRAEGEATGAKAWIVKPFQPARLLDVLSKLIAWAKSR